MKAVQHLRLLHLDEAARQFAVVLANTILDGRASRVWDLKLRVCGRLMKEVCRMIVLRRHRRSRRGISWRIWRRCRRRLMRCEWALGMAEMGKTLSWTGSLRLSEIEVLAAVSKQPRDLLVCS